MSGTSIFWLVLTIILVVVEAATPVLVCIWPAIGALIAFVLSLFSVPLWVQIIVFVVLSVLLVFLTRPLAKKYVHSKIVSTNADRIVGMEAIVIEKIDSIENIGQIKVMGQVWSAKSESGKPIQPGTSVTITSLEGVKAVVKETNKI